RGGPRRARPGPRTQSTHGPYESASFPKEAGGEAGDGQGPVGAGGPAHGRGDERGPRALPRERDHEGGPRGLLPPHSRPDAAPPRGPAAHAEPLPRGDRAAGLRPAARGGP